MTCLRSVSDEPGITPAQGGAFWRRAVLKLLLMAIIDAIHHTRTHAHLHTRTHARTERERERERFFGGGEGGGGGGDEERNIEIRSRGPDLELFVCCLVVVHLCCSLNDV